MIGLTDFFHGFFAPVYGFRRLISDSKLRALSVLPLLISLVAGSIMTVGGLYFLSQAIAAIALQIGQLAAWEPGGFMSIALTILLWPLGLLMLGVAIYIGIRLIAAPFYAFLAERALVVLGAKPDLKFTLQSIPQWLLLTLRLLVISLVRAVLFGIAGILLFVLSMVPVLNVIAALGFMHMIAFDISDYSFEAMEWSLAQRFRHVRENLMTYTGLACGLGLTMSIPGINLVFLPAAVVGASETLHRTLRKRSTAGMKDLS